MKKRSKIGLVLVAVSLLYLGGFLEPLELRLMDFGFRVRSRPASSDLVVVTIDPLSLQMLETWPWPRGYHATVLDKLMAAGARRVAFDVDFSSRSLSGEDREFEKSLAAAGKRAILPVFVQRAGADETKMVETRPLLSFRRHVTLASVNIRSGSDGLVRQYGTDEPYIKELPSLAQALASDKNEVSVPFYIDYRIQPGSISQLSYVDVLTGHYDPKTVAGKSVIIGATAVELGDHLAVPVYGTIPGVLLQALAYESLQQGRILQRAGPVSGLGLALLLSLLLGPGILASSWRRGLVLVLGVSTGLVILSILAQELLPWIVDISPGLLTLAGSYGLGLVLRIEHQGVHLFLLKRTVQRKKALIDQVFAKNFDGIVTIDDHDIINTCNPSMTQMFGRDREEIIGRSLDSLIRSNSVEKEECREIPALSVPTEMLGCRPDGGTFPVEVVLSDIPMDDQNLRLGLLRDVSERRAQEDLLEHQATHDVLTELPNRSFLDQQMKLALQRALEEERLLSFLILDLDRFKEVNDTLGHHVGDLLLQQISKRLQTSMREGDTIARLGGDEFAILLPDANREMALRKAREFLRILEAPFRVMDYSLQVGASVGIALFPDHGTDSTLLMQRADIAMYVDKRQRAGGTVYDSTKDENSLRNLTLVGELRQAIETDSFVLSYQPKVSCQGIQPVGMEALVRWRHPRLGILPPDEFIFLAEKSGLIRPLTYWVLNAALEQYACWRKQGLEMPVAVNLSPENLRDPELPEHLARIIRKWSIPPKNLILEITESVLMEDPERSLEIATELDALGVGISIDDFGTGYSSLTYLRKLPASEIKIDKSFVMEMDRNRGDAIIVRSTIELAHSLGLSVVAEGVESKNVLAQLCSMGCDNAQGYYFSKPLPSEDVLPWLQSRTLVQPPAFPITDQA